MINLKNTENKFVLADGLFQSSRLFVGAISVMYLLSKNITAEEIAMIKIIQGICFFLFDIPTGIFADLFGRKNSLIASALTGTIGFLFYIFSNSLHYFIVAEAFCALSICFWSGAFAAYAIDICQLKESQGRLDRFIHKNQALNSIMIAVSGILGGYLASFSFNYSYFSSLFLIICEFIFIIKILPNENFVFKKNKVDYKNALNKLFYGLNGKLKNTLYLLKSTKIQNKGVFFSFVLLCIMLQFTIQPILHYWQPAFSEKTQNLMPNSLFGVIFALYSVTSSLSGIVFFKLTKFKFFIDPKFLPFIVLSFCCMLSLFSVCKNLIYSVILFCMLQGGLSVFQSFISARINEMIDSDLRATFLSAISTISRLGMIVSLFTLKFILSTKNISYSHLFSIFSFFSTVMLLISLVIVRQKSLGYKYAKD